MRRKRPQRETQNTDADRLSAELQREVRRNRRLAFGVRALRIVAVAGFLAVFARLLVAAWDPLMETTLSFSDGTPAERIVVHIKKEREVREDPWQANWPDAFSPTTRVIDGAAYTPALFAAFLLLGGVWIITPRPRYTALEMLAESEEGSAVGPLTTTLEIADPVVRSTGIACLCRLLPTITEADADRLDARQRARLYAVLDIRRAEADFEIIMAVLTLLERMGDERALPYVERLAESPISTNPQERVRAAARQCLPHLQQCAESGHVRRTLLRATERPESPADGLLRPTGASCVVPPQQLLRAKERPAVAQITVGGTATTNEPPAPQVR